MKGRLFLIPTLIADETTQAAIPVTVREVVKGIDYFLCENARSARRFIGGLKVHSSIEAIRFELLNKDTREGDLSALFEPLHAGKDAGVLSESGCPGVADPGALAVR